MSSGGLTGGIYKPLNPAQVEMIHDEALRLLEDVGMTYESGQDDMLALLKHAGCRVDQTATITRPRSNFSKSSATSQRRWRFSSFWSPSLRANWPITRNTGWLSRITLRNSLIRRSASSRSS